MTDLSRRLAKLEHRAKPAAGDLVVALGDAPFPPHAPDAQRLRVVFVHSTGDGRPASTSGERHV